MFARTPGCAAKVEGLPGACLGPGAACVVAMVAKRQPSDLMCGFKDFGSRSVFFAYIHASAFRPRSALLFQAKAFHSLPSSGSSQASFSVQA